MSVARALEINARLRAAGVVVHEWGGWESRGNGQTSAYEGCIVHHTASAYGFAPAVLVNGRADLPGPLCNYAGNADGSVTVIAAHPANHAGASGGYATAPLPVTSLFNKRVMGLEIVYPGDQPMTAAQYRTAGMWARIVTDVLGFGDIGRARAHAETSVTGKWDPGYAPGRTIDMNRFRIDSADVFAPPAEAVEEIPMMSQLPATGPDPVYTSFGRPWLDRAVKLYMGTGANIKIPQVWYRDDKGALLSVGPGSVDGHYQAAIAVNNPDYLVVPAGTVQISMNYQCDQDIALTWAPA